MPTLIYIAGPYDKFSAWCADNGIDTASPLLRYLGSHYMSFNAVNIPMRGVAVVNLGDEELDSWLSLRIRGRNGERVHRA